MVIVSQLGKADMNSETMNDLKAFVTKTRSAPAPANDQLAAQVETVASAHDDTEAADAEKAIQDIGPSAVPLLQERIKTANDAGRTRLRHLIDDLSPPALAGEPE
jgi:3-phosphoglycerate kinase